MALIPCPECGGNVSTSASACPHCGFPIAKRTNYPKANTNNHDLLSQVAMFPLSSEQPRARVCAKCARPYFYAIGHKDNDTPMCACNAPSVEIDISQKEMDDNALLTHFVDIYERLILPRNIGDKSSPEYKAQVNKLYEDLNRSLSINGKPPHDPPFPIKDMIDRSSWKTHQAVAPPQKPHNAPVCPFCRSADLSKISATKSFLKIATFGLAGAGDVGKTWKCNNCGSRF